MMLEIHLEGTDAVLVHACAERPDVVRFGSGELYRFYRYTKPRGGGKRAALYRRATVADFALLHFHKSDA